jgi:hypothetical protein
MNLTTTTQLQVWITSPADDGESWNPWTLHGVYQEIEAHRVARSLRSTRHGHLVAVTGMTRTPLDPKTYAA